MKKAESQWLILCFFSLSPYRFILPTRYESPSYSFNSRIVGKQCFQIGLNMIVWSYSIAQIQHVGDSEVWSFLLILA